jgi:hypothetical protein
MARVPGQTRAELVDSLVVTRPAENEFEVTTYARVCEEHGFAGVFGPDRQKAVDAAERHATRWHEDITD